MNVCVTLFPRKVTFRGPGGRGFSTSLCGTLCCPRQAPLCLSARVSVAPPPLSLQQGSWAGLALQARLCGVQHASTSDRRGRGGACPHLLVGGGALVPTCCRTSSEPQDLCFQRRHYSVVSYVERIVARRVARAGCHQRFSEGPDAAPFTACSQNQGHRGRPRRTLRKRRVKGCAERWRPAFRGRARFRHVLAE